MAAVSTEGSLRSIGFGYPGLPDYRRSGSAAIAHRAELEGVKAK
jgi:hypothetical protein